MTGNEITQLNHDIRMRVSRRRVLLPLQRDNYYTFLTPDEIPGFLAERKFFLWLDQHTTGKFFLTNNLIGFINERDAIVYKLMHNE